LPHSIEAFLEHGADELIFRRYGRLSPFERDRRLFAARRVHCRIDFARFALLFDTLLSRMEAIFYLAASAQPLLPLHFFSHKRDSLSRPRSTRLSQLALHYAWLEVRFASRLRASFCAPRHRAHQDDTMNIISVVIECDLVMAAIYRQISLLLALPAPAYAFTQFHSAPTQFRLASPLGSGLRLLRRPLGPTLNITSDAMGDRASRFIRYLPRKPHAFYMAGAVAHALL